MLQSDFASFTRLLVLVFLRFRESRFQNCIKIAAIFSSVRADEHKKKRASEKKVQQESFVPSKHCLVVYNASIFNFSSY